MTPPPRTSTRVSATFSAPIRVHWPERAARSGRHTAVRPDIPLDVQPGKSRGVTQPRRLTRVAVHSPPDMDRTRRHPIALRIYRRLHRGRLQLTTLCHQSPARKPQRHSGNGSPTDALGDPDIPHRGQKSAFARAAAEPPLANLAASVLISPGRNNQPALRRNGRFSGSSVGKRRAEPHGHKSFRPSFSTSSVSTPTIRLPRLTRDSLEGTPGGACQTAQRMSRCHGRGT